MSAAGAVKVMRKARVKGPPSVEMVKCRADTGKDASRPQVRVQSMAEARLKDEFGEKNM